jgi:glycosyltransferase involved in cell wall biosynthesis
VHLVIVGPDEERTSEAMREACGTHASRLHVIGLSNEPERYMAASDVCCLPSHREGFGAVIIEAAAAGLPAIGSRIYGITDAIEDGVTGLLVEAGDVAALGAAMRELAANAPLRHTLGVAARDRALRDFSDAAITAALVDFYARIVPPAGAAQTQRP